MTHLLPKFQGLENEDSRKHLKKFNFVYSSMKSQGVFKEQIKLWTFSSSLDDAAKNWLFYLPPGSITTWTDIVKLFLNRFFLASRTGEIKREICSIKKRLRESSWLLRMIQAVVCKLPTTWHSRTIIHSLFLWSTAAHIEKNVGCS